MQKDLSTYDAPTAEENREAELIELAFLMQMPPHGYCASGTRLPWR